MMYYPKQNYQVMPLQNNDRFLIPFLGGALIGGAAVGLTRPRPIYNVAPYPNQFQPQGFNPNVPFGYYNYGYYYPNNFRPF